LSDTRILFDGVVAPTLANNPDGSMLVSLPSAPGSYQSRVVALNSDGQSSIFVQGNNVIQYNYATGSSGAFGMSMASLPAGQEAMIEINGTGTNFVAGQVLAGFGSSDIVAQQVFVVSPTQILVNVAIQSQAPPVAATVTVTSGLQLMSQSVAFQILPPTLNALVVSPILVNANTGLDGVSAGSMANVSVANLGGAGTTAAVLVNGQPTTTQSLGNGVLQFQVPTSLTPGPAVLTIQLGNGVVSYPVAFNVDLPPPVIDDALAGTSGELDSSYPAQPGQLITLIVEGIQSGTTLPITVTIGGQSQTPLSVLPSGDGVTTQVQLLVPGVVMTGSQVPVTITVGTRVSAPFNIPIASN
jgi:hypothetical protein